MQHETTLSQKTRFRVRRANGDLWARSICKILSTHTVISLYGIFLTRHPIINQYTRNNSMCRNCLNYNLTKLYDQFIIKPLIYVFLYIVCFMLIFDISNTSWHSPIPIHYSRFLFRSHIRRSRRRNICAVSHMRFSFFNEFRIYAIISVFVTWMSY